MKPILHTCERVNGWYKWQCLLCGKFFRVLPKTESCRPLKKFQEKAA